MQILSPRGCSEKPPPLAVPIRPGKAGPKGANFSAKEYRRIAAMLRKGMTNAQICAALGVKARTFHDRLQRAGKRIESKTQRRLVDAVDAVDAVPVQTAARQAAGQAATESTESDAAPGGAVPT